MAEYIDKEAVLLEINRQIRRQFLCIANVETIIKDAPAADVASVGWISVKDRMPEPEQEVLVIAHGWSGRLLYIGSYQRMEAQTSWLTGVTSKASDWSLWGWSYLREPEVTHWMPLPDPPKDTETEEKA